MKHAETTKNTKNKLALCLKKKLNQKPLSKITVSEIVQDCGLNRNTFYYHFDDTHDLIKWMLNQEAIQIVAQFDLITDYKEAIEFVMRYVEQNHALLQNIYFSVGSTELRRFFQADFVRIVRRLIDQAAELEELSVSDDYRDFLSHFYTEAVVGLILEGILNHQFLNQEKHIRYISAIIRSTIHSALRAH